MARGVSHKVRLIRRIEDASAHAITGRQICNQLDVLLDNLHRRQLPPSDYNLMIAKRDTERLRALLWLLQDELCALKKGQPHEQC